MEPLPKRSRSEFDGPGFGEPASAQQRQQDWGALQQGSGGGGDPECRHFNTPEGCPYGSSCRFRHVPNDGRDAEQPGLSFGGKPKPCMKFFSTSGCPFGESCHFLHYVPGGLSSLGLAPVVSFTAAAASHRKPVVPSGDPSITVNGYKTKLCNRFNTAEGCRFGDRCHFAHGEQELRLPHNVPRGNRRPMGDGPMGTTPPNFVNGNPYFMNGNGNFSNPGYSAPPGSVSDLNFQGYGGPHTPGAAGATDVSATYQSGPVSENVQVY